MLPNPIVTTPKVDVLPTDAFERMDDGGVRWSVKFSYKDSSGMLSGIAEQPVDLIPAAFLEHPHLLAYLDAVGLALQAIMRTTGTRWFTPSASLASKASSAEEFVAEIIRTNVADD